MNEIFTIFVVTIIAFSIVLIPSHAFIEKFSNRQFTYNTSYICNLLVFINLLLFLKLCNLSLDTIIKASFLFLIINLIVFIKKLKLQFQFFILILIFFFIISSIDIAYNLEIYWDGQKVWLNKAIILFNSGTIAEFKESIKPNYPFLGSILWSFAWKLSGSEYEYFGRIFYLIVFLSSLFFLASLIKINFIKKIFFILCFLFIYDYWHFRGTQEILVFSFLLISSCSVYLIKNERKNINYYIIYFLSLNLMIWTKNEAIFFAIFLTIILCINNKIKNMNKFIIIICSILLIFLRFIIFELYNFENNLSRDYDFKNLFETLISNLNFNNFIFILKNLIISFIKFPHILPSIFLLFLLSKKKIKDNYEYLVFYLLSIFFIIFIYLTSNKDFIHMVLTGLNRIVFEISSLILIFFIITINSLKVTNFLNKK